METLMTIAELAEKIRMTESTVRSYVLRKIIPYVKIGAAVRFVPEEINRWLVSKTKPAATLNSPKDVVADGENEYL